MTPAKPYVVSVYAGSGDMVDDVLKEAAYDLGKVKWRSHERLMSTHFPLPAIRNLTFQSFTSLLRQ